VRLFEHEAKALLAGHGVLVPAGVVLYTPELPDDAPVPAAVKAQVLGGKRGKAGGVKLSASRLEIEAAIHALLGSTLLGLRVDAVLVEQQLDIERELYLGLYLDRMMSLPTLLATPRGGVDVDEADDDCLLRLPVHVFSGLRPYHRHAVRRALGVPLSLASELDRVLNAMWAIFLDMDATLLELNPLALTRDGHLIAADARLVIDDRAAASHPEYPGDRGGLTVYERGASARQAIGVQMDGDTAIITSGAGVMMATADSLRARGGRPGALLDLGGFSRSVAEQADVMRLVLDCSPRVVFVNFFTQVLRCDELAEAIVAAFAASGTRVVARLTGHMSERGRDILAAAGMQVTDSYGTACDLAVSS